VVLMTIAISYATSGDFVTESSSPTSLASPSTSLDSTMQKNGNRRLTVGCGSERVIVILELPFERVEQQLLIGVHTEERRKMTMDRPNSPTYLKDFKRQKCAVCDCQEKFNFHVPDEIWKKVVSIKYRNRVICLSCFDSFAREKDVDYADSINDLLFAGEKAAVKFETKSSQDI
jgi:hypothetical protein